MTDYGRPVTAAHMHIDSEIAPLRHVMVHRPGDEIVRMTQHELDLSLFDDILSPPETVREHDLMVEILRGAGARVSDVTDLIRSALERASPEVRHELLLSCTALAGASELAPWLAAWPAARLADGLVCGVYWHEVEDASVSLARIRARLRDSQGLALKPTPNLMFMRDPGMVVGSYVVMGRMATAARAREPLLVGFAIRHSGELEQPSLLFQPPEGAATPHGGCVSLEGGDVLVLSPEVIWIGCSERTSAQAIEALAREALFDACPGLNRVYAVLMPEQRSVMHLDTILTQIDERLFLGHLPLIDGSDDRALQVARLERDRPTALVHGASVMDVLREELGADTALVPCGGSDPLHQEREQWTDGANALALAPGRIILYARNVYTIAALAEHGFEEVRMHSVQPVDQRSELIAAGMRRLRTVFSFSGSELSRARGGGRCLTMPIEREA